MEDEPRNPFSGLMMSAVALHEWVETMVEAGFTRSEAIYFVLEITKEAMRNPATD